MGKKIRRIILWTLTAFLLYVFIGMLVPFANPSKPEAQYNSYEPDTYYGSSSSQRARIVEENTEALEERIRMITAAKEKIILSTFDMRKDESSLDISAALLEAAGRGVHIQILVDGISGLLRLEGEPMFYALSSHPNIEMRLYNKPNLIKPWTINGRMHDKYVICDHHLLLLGGRNTFRYFLGDYETKDRSYDREVLIYQPSKEEPDDAISQVEAYFHKVWDMPECRPFHEEEALSRRKNVAEAIQTLQSHYKQMQKEHPGWFDTAVSYEDRTVPIKKATLVSGETTSLGKQPLVWNELQKLMTHAKKRVVIHTPYAVMNDFMYQGMEEIHQSVADFSMVINSVENGDNLVASSDYLRHKKEILDTGVTLYEFDGGDSSHGKSILIDDDIAIVGSFNLDLRSVYMDTELMLVIHSEELNAQLEEYMDVFQQDCRKVTGGHTYETPAHIQVAEVPWWKRLIWKVLGFLLQPVRYLV
ncbi:MAG: phospholipase D family protein [Blautia sp.]|jgi:phosphatidylserine/phosphatidylglycerophosphate/cardiolipin synthase-like enzyme